MNRVNRCMCDWLVAPTLVLFNACCVAAEDEAQTMFNEQTYRSLVAESKAMRVGDVLTVVVQESSSATSSADLRSHRNFSLSAHVDLPRLGKHTGQGGAGSENDGAGRTQRSGRLLAQLSVRVIDQAPNGDLIVSGQQSLQINGEEQLITLSGVVRTRDITDGNTVLSSRIAQARIRFDGEGFVTDQSKPSWIVRLANFLGI
jgi:flagellar L-ring protein FlgH